MHDYQELREALGVGEDLLADIEAVIKYLNGAKTLGMFDIFGGGFITSMLKRSQMEKANDIIRNMNEKVYHFRSELKDIELRLDINFEVDTFNDFADIFFDNIFSDMSVQSKINDTKNQMLELQEKVEELVVYLRRELNKYR